MRYPQVLVLESRIEFLKQQYNSRQGGINTSHDDFAIHRDANKIIDHFATHADPTPTKQYTQWIVGKYHNGDFRQEDADRIYRAISGFHTYKHKLEEKDINKYPSLASIEDAVAPHENTPASKAEEKASAIHNGLKQILSNDNGEVYRLDSEEASKHVYGGGHARGGLGTSWCTAARSGGNQYKYYTADGGQLYTAHIKNDPLSPYQISLRSTGLGQIANRKDQTVPLSTITSKFPEMVGHHEFRHKDIAFALESDIPGLFAEHLRKPIDNSTVSTGMRIAAAAPHKISQENFDGYVDRIIEQAHTVDEKGKSNSIAASTLTSVINSPKASAANVHKLIDAHESLAEKNSGNQYGWLSHATPMSDDPTIIDRLIDVHTKHSKGNFVSYSTPKLNLAPKHFERLASMVKDHEYPHNGSMHYLLTHKDVPSEMLERYAKVDTENLHKNNYYHITSALSNPKVSSEAIEQAAKDTNLQPLLTVMPNTTSKALRDIYEQHAENQHGAWLLQNIKDHPNTPPDLRKKLTADFKSKVLPSRSFRLQPFDSIHAALAPGVEAKIIKNNDRTETHFNPYTGEPLTISSPHKAYKKGETKMTWHPSFEIMHPRVVNSTWTHEPHRIAAVNKNHTNRFQEIGRKDPVRSYASIHLTTGMVDPIRYLPGEYTDNEKQRMHDIAFQNAKESNKWRENYTDEHAHAEAQQYVQEIIKRFPKIKAFDRDTGEHLGSLVGSTVKYSDSYAPQMAQGFIERNDVSTDLINAQHGKHFNPLNPSVFFVNVVKAANKPKPRLVGLTTNVKDNIHNIYKIQTTPEEASKTHENHLVSAYGPNLAVTRTSPTSFTAISEPKWDGTQALHTSHVVGNILHHTKSSFAHKPDGTSVKKFSNIIEQALTEDAPTNAVSSGAIAGAGVGPQGEPGVSPRTKDKYRKGNAVLAALLKRKVEELR